MQNASASKSREKREVVITRVYDVPARFLFEAWSKPEHVREWFGPKGWPITLCEIDFRVAGRFRFAMTGSSGEQNTPFGGTYLEIVPNRKIVYDNAFELPGADLSHEELAVEVRPRQDDEFTCMSCFLVHHRSQLADAKRLICKDCA